MSNMLIVKPFITNIFSIEKFGKYSIAKLLQPEIPDFTFEFQVDGCVSHVFPSDEYPVYLLYRLFREGISKDTVKKLIELNLSDREIDCFEYIIENSSSYCLITDYGNHEYIDFKENDPVIVQDFESDDSLHVSRILR